MTNAPPQQGGASELFERLSLLREQLWLAAKIGGSLNPTPEQSADFDALFALAMRAAADEQVVKPCEGSVAHSDHAVEGQRWCLRAGRYCQNAPTQHCTRAAEAPTAAERCDWCHKWGGGHEPDCLSGAQHLSPSQTDEQEPR